MKLVLEQDDIKLHLEKIGELDFPTLFKAYQLVTGSDEVLEDMRSADEEEVDEKEGGTNESSREVHLNIPDNFTERLEQRRFADRDSKPQKELVDVDLQCPFCGEVKRLKAPEHFNRIFCPECGECLFLSWATGIRGEIDEDGYYYRACSPMVKKGERDDYEKMFNVHD
ncbi:hypothetical protein ACXM1Q_000225 [Streptococcus sp. 10F2]